MVVVVISSSHPTKESPCSNYGFLVKDLKSVKWPLFKIRDEGFLWFIHLVNDYKEMTRR